MTSELATAHETILKHKCTRMIAASIGKPFNIRQRATGNLIRGTISRCEWLGARQRRCSIIAQFNVWLKSDNGIEHGPFIMEKLPR